WVIEAREVAGPAPVHEHEEEEEEEEEEAPGPSMWPFVLALGVVGIALGLVYAWPYAALFVALPMAAASMAFWSDSIRRELMLAPPYTPGALPGAPPQAAIAAPAAGGGLVMPVPPRTLAAQAAAG